MFNTTDVPKSSRIPKLIAALYAHMPVIESARAKLITESYKATEGRNEPKILTSILANCANPAPIKRIRTHSPIFRCRITPDFIIPPIIRALRSF